MHISFSTPTHILHSLHNLNVNVSVCHISSFIQLSRSVAGIQPGNLTLEVAQRQREGVAVFVCRSIHQGHLYSHTVFTVCCDCSCTAGNEPESFISKLMNKCANKCIFFPLFFWKRALSCFINSWLAFSVCPQFKAKFALFKCDCHIWCDVIPDFTI